jgi:hypothetical protein
MATEVQDITAPDTTQESDATESKAEKHVFNGDYVADENGFVTFTVRFPLSAVKTSETWRPVEGLIGLAGNVGLVGYGDGDSPQATIGVERAQIRDKASGEKIVNPNAGRPTGTINLVLHTAETLAEARKRGRTAMTDTQKRTAAMASSIIKSALSKPGSETAIEAIMARVTSGEIDGATALEQIADLMR